MSLYAHYLLEREGISTLEGEYGFATYKVQGTDVYLRDIYIVPSKRKDGFASEMADQVAKLGRSQNCKRMIGSVSPEDPNATQNLKVLLAYGMRLLNASPGLIVFEKEI